MPTAAGRASVGARGWSRGPLCHRPPTPAPICSPSTAGVWLTTPPGRVGQTKVFRRRLATVLDERASRSVMLTTVHPRVAADAQQAAHQSCGVVVVHDEMVLLPPTQVAPRSEIFDQRNPDSTESRARVIEDRPRVSTGHVASLSSRDRFRENGFADQFEFPVDNESLTPPPVHVALPSTDLVPMTVRRPGAALGVSMNFQIGSRADEVVTNIPRQVPAAIAAELCRRSGKWDRRRHDGRPRRIRTRNDDRHPDS